MIWRSVAPPDMHKRYDQFGHGFKKALITEQLSRGLFRPTRLVQARASREISVPIDIFSLVSEAEPDSGDEAYDEQANSDA